MNKKSYSVLDWHVVAQCIHSFADPTCGVLSMCSRSQCKMWKSERRASHSEGEPAWCCLHQRPDFSVMTSKHLSGFLWDGPSSGVKNSDRLIKTERSQLTYHGGVAGFMSGFVIFLCRCCGELKASSIFWIEYICRGCPLLHRRSLR